MICLGQPIRRTLLIAVVMACGQGHAARTSAQLLLPGSGQAAPFELDPSVDLDRADSNTLAYLERVNAQLADRQWDEAISTLRQVIEDSADQLIGVTEHRFIPLREYGHIQLAALPEDALRLYRARVDPMAGQWLKQGIAGRDRLALLRVVEQAFASHSGDDALAALGEMALETGDYAAARWYWQRILPATRPENAPPTWPGYPDSDLDLAGIRARLVLVSILEGSVDRATSELDRFGRLHGDATGRMGGRVTNYVKELLSLLGES